jgi:pre-rRNA-processing protein IPI1
MSSFLAHAVAMEVPSQDSGSPGSGIPTWYMASSFASPGSFKAFQQLLVPRLTSECQASFSREWKGEVGLDSTHERPLPLFPLVDVSSANSMSLQDLADIELLSFEANDERHQIVNVRPNHSYMYDF